MGTIEIIISHLEASHLFWLIMAFVVGVFATVLSVVFTKTKISTPVIKINDTKEEGKS